MKKLVIRVLVSLVLLAAAWGGYYLYKQVQQKDEVLATTQVRQGDVIIRSYARGELRAVRTASLVAPNLFGAVQVTRLAPLGGLAREKDLIVEFDDAEVRSRLEERELELQQLDENIKKSQAELQIRSNQDQVELMQARYSVRRAELEVKRNELLSAIQQKTNILNLEEARRRLKQLEVDIKSRQEQARAQLAVLQERRNRSLLELRRERMRLMQVKLLAPMDGLVAVRQSRPMGGFFRGMQLPDIREGDQVFPGMPIADVMDLSELEVSAKVGELDRASLHEGQDVTFRLDAVADKVFHGRIKSLSGTASANVWSNDPAKKFDVTFSVDMKQLLTGLGASQEQIDRVLATAARNRNRPPMTAVQAPSLEMASFGGARAGGDNGGERRMMQFGPAPGGPDTASEGGEARQQRRQRPQLPPDVQKKVQAEMDKVLKGRSRAELSDEERQKLGEAMRKVMQAAGIQMPSRGGRAAGGREMGGGPEMMMMGGAPGQPYSEKELEAAQLPAAPEEESELDVLLRPGLLADVEIIVEKVPNAIYIPAQAVFEKDGRPIVYVETGGRFEERIVKPLKQSESVIVVADGLKPGEVIALTDIGRTLRKGSAKGGAKKSSLPVGGKGGK